MTKNRVMRWILGRFRAKIQKKDYAVSKDGFPGW